VAKKQEKRKNSTVRCSNT